MTKREEVINKFIEKRSYLTNGAGSLAIVFGISKGEAKICKALAKERIKNGMVPVVTTEKACDEGADMRSAAKLYLEATRVKTVVKPQLEALTPSIQEQVGMHIMMGCNHVPFENKQLHKGIIELLKDYRRDIKGFHLMGDFMDINTLSSHDKGKFTAVKGLTLDDEYDAGNVLLDAFEDALPNDCWKTYLYGNHEDRWNRWMSNMDNAKTPLASPTKGLNLIERGYQVKDRWSQDFFTIGNNFEIFHGIYFSVHCAKAHLDKLPNSCAFVHTHRSQVYREGQRAAYNIGSCADFNSKAFGYATRPMKAQWSNGFAINMVDSNGVSNVTQIHVNPDGKFYFGGKQY